MNCMKYLNDFSRHENFNRVMRIVVVVCQCFKFKMGKGRQKLHWSEMGGARTIQWVGLVHHR